MSGAISAIGSAIGGVLGMIPCSFRGIPVQMTTCEIAVKGQYKVHLGAYWSHPIAEYLGKGQKTIKIEGFIDPNLSFVERPLLETMILSPGGGFLSIPDYGLFYATCLGASFSTDLSNFVEVSLEFVETRSPFGDTAAALLSGSIPDAIGSAIGDVQSSITSDIAGLL